MHLKTSLAILSSLLLPCFSNAWADESPNPEKSLERLLEGNKRFVAGTPVHPHQNNDYRASLAAGQKPFVSILTCADSRVSPELVFDQGLGDIFDCRVAGNILDDAVLGSLEYAVEHLHTALIVVLGHEKCGAVKAAVDGGHAEGHIGQLVEAIAPAVAEVKGQPGEVLDNAVRANVRRVVKLLSVAGPIISEHVQSGKLKIVGARYDLATGSVSLVPMNVEEKASQTPKLTTIAP
ncbi:MAG: carbonic anhydrase [Chthoniobacteraceae bacterium]